VRGIAIGGRKKNDLSKKKSEKREINGGNIKPRAEKPAKGQECRKIPKNFSWAFQKGIA